MCLRRKQPNFPGNTPAPEDPESPQSPFSNSEVLSNYYVLNSMAFSVLASRNSEDAQSNSKSTSSLHGLSKTEVELRMDEVEEKTVARCNIEQLIKDAIKQKTNFIKTYLSFLSPYDLRPLENCPEHHLQRCPLEYCSVAEENVKLGKRGKPKSVYLRENLRPIVEKLHEIKMLEEINVKEVVNEHKCVANAYMFMVEKIGSEVKEQFLEQLKTLELVAADVTSVTKLRIITDARAGNAKTKTSLPYNIFTLEALFQCIANVKANADKAENQQKKYEPQDDDEKRKPTTRKWFCVNADLRHWFHQILCPPSHRDLFRLTFNGGATYRSRTLPMGWYLSPPLAQAVTWSMLLLVDEHMIVPGVRNPRAVVEGPDMPMWLPFDADNADGGVFVLQDNVFVVTSVESIATSWRDRLVKISSKSKGYNAEFKKEVKVEEIVQGDEQSFTEFCGMDFAYSKRRVARRTKPEKLEENEHLSHRQVSSMLGEILWDRRVRGIRSLDESSASFMKLFSLNSPPSHDKWNDKSGKFSRGSEQRKTLEHFLRDCREHHWKDYSSAWVPDKDHTHWYAVDAAMGTQSREKGVAVDALMATVSLNFKKRLPWKRFSSKHTYIGEAELEAIVLAVEDALEKDQETSMIVVLTDSMCAKGWVERMYSNRPVAQELLRYLDKLLDNGRIRICCVYIRTDNNIADVPTRPSEADLEEGNEGAFLEKDKKEEWYSRFEATLKLKACIKAGVMKESVISGRQCSRRARDESQKKEVKVEEKEWRSKNVEAQKTGN